MATNIPTHNLREVNEAVQWSLAHPNASHEELLEACMEMPTAIPEEPLTSRLGNLDGKTTGSVSLLS
jgi:hypothetical protein